MATSMTGKTPSLSSSALVKRATHEGLRAAAETIADAARAISGRFSRRIPASIRVTVAGKSAAVKAGGRKGELAPNAAMFETPGARHPLFGDKSHWYFQPHRPFLEEAAQARGDKAAEEYADAVIDSWKRTLGFK